jgi:hypothetical protein
MSLTYCDGLMLRKTCAHHGGPVGFGGGNEVRRVGRKFEARWRVVASEGRIVECLGVVRRLTECGRYRRRLFGDFEGAAAFQPSTNHKTDHGFLLFVIFIGQGQRSAAIDREVLATGLVPQLDLIHPTR